MIKQLTKSMLHALGYEAHRYNLRPRLCAFFQAWKCASPAPSFIIDVGANHGAWTRSVFNYFPDARYLMIEPQDRLRVHSRDLLQRPNVRWVTAGISDQIGKMMLTLPPRDDSATFATSEESARALGYPQIEVPVTTLNETVRLEKQIPNMVKIDAEGLDLRALRGASQLLGVTDVFLIECGICCLSLENSIEAVCSLMSENGYRIADFTDLNHSPKDGFLWLAEVVFVKKSSSVWEKLDTYE